MPLGGYVVVMAGPPEEQRGRSRDEETSEETASIDGAEDVTAPTGQPTDSEDPSQRATAPIFEQPPQPVVVPERVGSIRLERELGRGATASVHLGIDEVLGRSVAVKLFTRYAGATASEHASRIFAGVRAALDTDHEGLVQVHFVDVHDKDGAALPYAVMEYVEGPTLADKLRDDGPMKPTDAVRVVMEIADVVDALHRADLVHGDIKPANTLIPPLRGVKVTDFGLTRSRDAGISGPQKDHTAGTPAYMSPELRQTGHVAPRSDVYALGVTLYELVTGTRRIEELPESGIQEELAEVIDRACRPDPLLRYKTAGRLRDALAGLKLDHVAAAPRPKDAGKDDEPGSSSTMTTSTVLERVKRAREELRDSPMALEPLPKPKRRRRKKPTEPPPEEPRPPASDDDGTTTFFQRLFGKRKK